MNNTQNAAAWDKPLFRSAEAAIYWAWYQAPSRANTVKPSSIVGMIGKDSREQRDEQIAKVSSDAFMFERKPNGYDASAQAGMIKGYVSRLSSEERFHIMARFLKGQERARARRALSGIILAYIEDGRSNRRLVLRLLARHYGQPGIFIEDLAERYKVKGGRRAVTAINREVVITLDAVGFRAESRVLDYLQERGVIQ